MKRLMLAAILTLLIVGCAEKSAPVVTPAWIAPPPPTAAELAYRAQLWQSLPAYPIFMGPTWPGACCVTPSAFVPACSQPFATR